ncbi:MAG: hypothetical protein MPEBLZ_01797 [Candidatus Methanoperedens nitroreducens]|uniref:Uncharacterized protein n=1 Tax=Candidatus Methanoperedens nitratireducens TaxID=1392998 RepID=A0A0P7ZFP8_9EURY|nr:hypothetical protein [Candidatus Methanoperedens sp. BLZ2]KAB2948452.1 MAG: hypothetical protein F9K14_01085 [Candidatus Methanoperedens sp.]KPQ43614.1 MAG: hypothetical protein MPEBLZ_01797 [Candidatus Methanoperedens sp. BLZ1]MBZ0174452.1 hypothetical protein [Candidatus Methanoperedens nitroreducens]MCX9078472.1 hypothetical protein [Candidatus Methanoperedens sp.]
MNLKAGLYCNDIQKIYVFWSKNRPELAKKVDKLSKSYRDALAQSGQNYYNSQVLELSVRQVGLMEQMGEVLNSDSFCRKNETRICDQFAIIFQREDEIRNIMIALGFISEPKEEKEDINKGKEGKK